LVRQNCVPARPNIGRTTFFAVAILLCWPFWASAADLTGRASVIDGDTIEIHGQRIRLFGIDAPESRQTCEAEQQTYRCGQQAALALVDHIGQRTVACEERDVDRYGRMVAVCRVDGEDIGAWMVAQGWALAYSRYSRDYFDEELAARANKRGMWRGNFMRPWLWRERGASIGYEGSTGAGQSQPSGATCCKVCTTGKGLRRQLHQQDEDLSQTTGVRVQCAMIGSGLSSQVADRRQRQIPPALANPELLWSY
jgi:endonuclease YncB( thermonuclease family)